MAATTPIKIERVKVVDLPLLLPLMRAYCEFYEVAPRDDRLVALSRALIEDPGEGIQLLARDEEGKPVGFATVFWTWSTLDAMRIGLMNDLFVDSGHPRRWRRQTADRALSRAVPQARSEQAHLGDGA